MSLSLLKRFMISSLMPALALAYSGPASGNTSALRESSMALELRDPFRRPEAVQEETRPRTPLERYAIGELTLVGIMSGPERLRAMVLAPDGKTYFVAERMRIGTRKGIVQKITQDTVYIQEKIVNVLGDEENVSVEMKLNTHANKED